MSKITYNRGTTYNITHVYKKNGVLSTDGARLLFTVKSVIDNDLTDAAAIILKNIVMSGATNVITLAPGDVGVTVDDGTYVYDIKVHETGGAIYLADSGRFILDVTATNRITP